MTFRALVEPQLLKLEGSQRSTALLDWLHRYLTGAAEAYDWPAGLVDRVFSRVMDSGFVFTAHTPSRLNAPRTLRVHAEFDIDLDAIRHYTLVLEDRDGTLAVAQHSKRSFAEVDVFLSDFRKAAWPTPRSFHMPMLYGSVDLVVNAPMEWQPAGRMRPMKKGGSKPRRQPELRRPDLAADEFWALIAELNGKADFSAMEKLTARLATLTEAQIRAFSLYLTDALSALDTDEHRNQPIRDVADAPNDPELDLSDDAFLYARCSAVAYGKRYWSDAVTRPETFAGVHDLGAERLLFVASEAFEQSTGRRWPWD